MKTVGIIADTHFSPHHPFASEIATYFSDVDMILHAGDVGDLNDYAKLEALATMHTTMGNKKRELASYPFPRSQTIQVEQVTFFVHHGYMHDLSDYVLYFLGKICRQYTLTSWIMALRLRAIAPADTRVIVFGHTHFHFVRYLGGILVLNPGAAHAKKARLASLMKVIVDGKKITRIETFYLPARRPQE